MKDLWLLLVLACVLVLVSILASKASGRSGVPALLLFLGIGMLAGSEGIGGIYFDNAELARAVGVVALALILFSGGLDTRWDAIRPVLGRGVVLATVGTVATAGLVGGLVLLVTDLPLLEALLLGAVVSSTDAAAVFSILRARKVQLPSPVRNLLELESGSQRPHGGVPHRQPHRADHRGRRLAAGARLVVRPADGPRRAARLRARTRHGLGDQPHRPGPRRPLPRAQPHALLLTFGLTSSVGGSGFLAVYVAGVVMGGRAYIHKRSLTRFHDGLAWLAQIAMFLTLGLLVFPSRIVPLMGVAVLIAAFLTLVARPLSVYLSLLGSRFSLREQTLVGWAGLRGAAPIILATFPLVAGVPGGEALFNIVFFIVLASTLVQGTTIPAVARWLRVRGPAYEAEPVWAGEPVRRDLVEYRVPEDSPVVGRQVAQAGLPAGADVVLLRRYDTFVVVRGSTRLRRDDVLLLLADEHSQRLLDERADLVRETVPALGVRREESPDRGAAPRLARGAPQAQRITPRAHRQSPHVGCGLPRQSSSLASASSQPQSVHGGKSKRRTRSRKATYSGFAQMPASVSSGRRPTSQRTIRFSRPRTKQVYVCSSGGQGLTPPCQATAQASPSTKGQ